MLRKTTAAAPSVFRPRRSVACLALAVALAAGPLHGAADAAGEGLLTLHVTDSKTKEPLPCRLHLVGPGKKPRKADPLPFWYDHIVFPGAVELKLPVGNYTFQLQCGLEYYTVSGNFKIDHFADDSKDVALRRYVDLTTEGWYSGDLYVRRPVRDAELLMLADDLHVAQFVTWWNDKVDTPAPPPKKKKEKGKPKERARATPWEAEKPKPLVCFDKDRCYQALAGGFSRAGTELLYFNLTAPLRQPQGEGEYPCEMTYLLKARENPDAWIDLTTPYCWDLPMLVALGQVDSIEVLNSRFCRRSVATNEGEGKPRDQRLYQGPFGNARWSQDIYFKLLECGLRIPPSAGSGSGVAPNPVGYNRVYVHLDGEFSYEAWWKNFRAGRVFVTNGPLLRADVEGQPPGAVLRGEPGQPREVAIALSLSFADPVSYLDIIQNGKIKHSVRLDEFVHNKGRLPKLSFNQSGWFLVRAVSDLSDSYRVALTAPYYVEIGYDRRVSKQAAQFFLDWTLERAGQIKLADPRQQSEVMAYHRKAQDYWQNLVSKANAE
jgi:hypothetical protein